jgi:hypothetical protein
VLMRVVTLPELEHAEVVQQQVAEVGRECAMVS